MNQITKLKITSKGFVHSTKIFTEDGQELRVRDISLAVENGFWVARLTVDRIELDLESVAVVTKRVACPKCKAEEKVIDIDTTKMSIDALLEHAKTHKSTQAEIDKHQISFAYGNAHLSNPSITTQHIEKAFEELYGRKPAYLEEQKG